MTRRKIQAAIFRNRHGGSGPLIEDRFKISESQNLVKKIV